LSRKGFTLLELLVAILASLVVLGAIAATFIIQDRSYNRENQVVDVQENARAGMHMITQLLAMAGYDPTGTAGAGLLTAASDEIRFTMDLNGSGVIGDEITGEADEDITFALDTTDLQLTMDNQPLAENIPPNGLAFTYFDNNDNELTPTGTPALLSATDLALVTRITIQLTARTQDPDPDYPGGYRTRTLTSEVFVANLAFGDTTTATTTVGTTTEGTTSEGTSTAGTSTAETSTAETSTAETTTVETSTGETPTTETPSTETPTTETPTTGGETTAPTTTEPLDTTGPAITNITQVPDS
jgi:type IV pilus assembly protein PilW